jgi:predicted nucleic acid-binding protein
LLRNHHVILVIVIYTEAELRTGAAKSTSAARTLRLLENFLRPLSILEFTSGDAASYAQIRARLERAGTPIGPLDTLIAAQAVARKLALVSNNERSLAGSQASIFRTGQVSLVRSCWNASRQGIRLVILAPSPELSPANQDEEKLTLIGAGTGGPGPCPGAHCADVLR